MSKFHINKKGIPSQCKAKAGNCPLGGDEQHFETKEEASKFIEKEKSKEFGILPEMKQPDPKILENNEEIGKLQKSIDDAREKVKAGLILDDEAVSTIYRMMWYYEDKIKRMQAENETLYKKDGILSPKAKVKKDLMEMKSLDEVESYVQGMLEEHQEDALKHTLNHFKVEDTYALGKYDSEQQTMDCGWLHWRVADGDVNAKIKELTKAKYGYSDNTIRLSLPVRVQGTIIQSVAAEYLKEKVADKIPLAYNVHLD